MGKTLAPTPAPTPAPTLEPDLKLAWIRYELNLDVDLNGLSAADTIALKTGVITSTVQTMNDGGDDTFTAADIAEVRLKQKPQTERRLRSRKSTNPIRTTVTFAATVDTIPTILTNEISAGTFVVTARVGGVTMTGHVAMTGIVTNDGAIDAVDKGTEEVLLDSAFVMPPEGTAFIVLFTIAGLLVAVAAIVTKNAKMPARVVPTGAPTGTPTGAPDLLLQPGNSTIELQDDAYITNKEDAPLGRHPARSLTARVPVVPSSSSSLAPLIRTHNFDVPSKV